ncbi:MAG: DUF4175 family protein [Balneolales bacterium]
MLNRRVGPVPGSEHNQPSLDGLRRLVYRYHRRLLTKRRTGIAFMVLSAVLALLLLLLVVEQFQYFPPAVKTTLWVIAPAAGVILFFLLAVRVHDLSFNTFYSDASRAIGNPSLRYLIDFEQFKRRGDTKLYRAAVDQNLSLISLDRLSVQLKDYSDHHWYRKLHTWSMSGFAGLALLFASAGVLSPEALKRTVLFWEEFEKPLPFTYRIEPGHAIVAQGDPFQARVEFSDGRIPDNVTLAIKTDIESDFRLRPMRRGSEDAYVSDDLELYNHARYFIRMDGHESEVFRADVQLLPRFGHLSVTITPPAYTGLDPDETSYPFSRIDAYPGSELLVEARANKDLVRSTLIRHIAGDTLSLSPDEENRLTQKLAVTAEDSLSFQLEDEFGLTNSNSFSFFVNTRQDQAPFVNILQPERELTRRDPDQLQLRYEFEDDFGFTGAELHYKLNKAYVEQPVTGNIPLRVPEGSAGEHLFEWDLGDLGLTSLDEVEYWLEVTDNDAVSSYKTTRSESHYLNVQSLAEYFLDQEERESEIGDSFEQARDAHRRMQDNFQRFREQIRNDPDDSWEQSRILDDIKEERRDLDEQVDELKEQFEELTRDMDDSQSLSEETMQQYKELQELIGEIDDPEIMKMIEELQQNLENFDQAELRKALDEIEFNESTYRERMERTVELFKTLRMNAELDQMAEMLKDLGAREQQLMEQDAIGDEQAQQQESIQEQLEDLSQKLDNLPDKSPERRRNKMERLRDDLRPEMDSMDRQLQENIEDMQQESPDREKIRQDQDQLQQQMGEMAEQISSARQEMNQQQLQINLTALKSLLQSMVLLSEAQEDVATETAELARNSPAFVMQARNQRNIRRNFEFIADSLYRVSVEIPQFSNRINQRKREILTNMQKATDYLVERDPRDATTEERTALGGLNEIGSMLADLIDQLNDQMDGEGMGGMSAEQMLEQMQNLSGDQQQLNQQIQDMINDLQGERLSQDQMERLNQMARQQNEIRRQMRELQRSGGFGSGDEILSEMERLGEQMEDAINGLRGGQLDRVMVERQQNIMSRMLEAEKAVEQRDQDEERRRGDTAGDYERSNPPELTLEELQREIRSGIRDADRTRFSEDYQRLIERYFELLEDMVR